jgi:hypothetical protein
VALSATASSTGWTSVGERLMTPRIALVAVCRSRASVNSRLLACSSLNSRTFSMAMTAWSAKVFSRAICLSVNGTASARRRLIEPSTTPSRSSGTLSAVRVPASRALALPSGNSSVSAGRSMT